MSNKYRSEIPDNGQFVLVYFCLGQVWSTTLKIHSGIYYEYSDMLSDWRCPSQECFDLIKHGSTYQLIDVVTKDKTVSYR